MAEKEILFYSKRVEYGWLSNFYPAPQVVDGKLYKSNEHYYQSRKAVNEEYQEWIRNAPTAYLAMKAGRSLRISADELLPHWDDVKASFMLHGLRAKFHQNPDLAKKLIATGDAILHEDSPYDMFWGRKGKDMLGKLLMQVREELKGDKYEV